MRMANIACQTIAMLIDSPFTTSTVGSEFDALEMRVVCFGVLQTVSRTIWWYQHGLFQRIWLEDVQVVFEVYLEWLLTWSV
jgi:hypothetical protein